MDGQQVNHAAEWPYGGLDVAALRSAGWRPTPFTQFVVKLHSRCNLACDYCYVYAMGDVTWRSAPRVMSAATVRAVSRRIAEHVEKFGLDRVEIIFHGGEPLLAGAEVLDSAAAAIRAAVPSRCAVAMSVQTNGLLIDDAILAVLHRHEIRIGVSLDGPPEVHDRHRVFSTGKGSFAAVARALHTLGRPEHRELFAGILCTVDVRSDPIATYGALLEFAPPAIDFLLPHGNWTAPPPLRDPKTTDTPYGDWLVAVFDRWYGAPGPETGVRFFEQILNGLLGGRSTSELIGLSPVGVLVIDTGGRLEQVDSLRSAHPGAAEAGLDVFSADFAAALDHPGIVARQIGADALHETCARCPIQRVCGAGFYPHRYRAGSGFRNPSVYCPDLELLIRHVTGRVESHLRLLSRSGT